MVTDFEKALATLTAGGMQCIVIGGVAGNKGLAIWGNSMRNPSPVFLTSRAAC
jgi:hypothetical protein